MKMESGKMIKSDMFTIPIMDMPTEWRMWIYPNGHKDDCKGYVTTFVEKTTATESVIETNLVFTLVDKHGSKVNNTSKSAKHIFEKKDNLGRGYGKFKSHEELLNLANVLPDDTITIMCEITIKEAGVNVLSNGSNTMLLPASKDEASADRYMEDMRRAFDAGKFTDATILCDDEEFHCHKVILAGRSSVFETMFSVEMKEKIDNQVVIKDMDADTLGEMLGYIYGCSANVNTGEKATNLLIAAEKYDLKELKQICENSLCLSLDVDNVVDRLILADLHCASNLHALALRFIKENGESIVDQEGCREKLSPDLMWDIINVMAKK